MLRYLTLCLIFVTAIYPCVCESNKTKLYLIGLFPYTGSWAGAEAIVPATRMAVQDVNAHPTVLPDSEIVIIPIDTTCDGGKATNGMYRELYNMSLTKVMVIGCGCSVATEPTAQASHHWNLIQISYGASSPKLSSRELFPRFFRLVQPESMLNVVKIALMQEFKWKKVAMLHESTLLFTLTASDFHRQAIEQQIEVIAAEVFLDNPSAQVASIKNSGARIIVAGFFSNMGRKVFCAAYHLGMFGVKYVWILPGWLEREWWRVPDDSIDCTLSQMDDVTNNHIALYIDDLPDDANRSPSISGMTSRQFVERYKEFAGTENPEGLVGFKERTFAYDTVWTVALALYETQKRLRQLVPPRSLEDYRYDSETVDILFEIISNMSFEGISGPVQFTSSGDRLGRNRITQLRDGEDVKVGVFNPIQEEIIWDGYESIYWPGGAPPIDFIIEREVWQTIHPAVFITCTVFALIGVAVACCFLAFNIHFRKFRVIKMSSPNLNNVMLMGGILAYISIIFHGVDTAVASTHVFEWTCKVKTWCLSIGFSLAFGSMFSKTWRVHKIFTNKTVLRMVVKDKWLYSFVALLVCLDVLILTVTETLDPLGAVEHRGSKVVSTENDDIVYIPIRMMCESGYQTYWIGAFYVIDGLLLIFGAFLAWETRKVTIPALNDSKYIGVCIYNVMILSFVGAPVTFVLEERNANYALVSGLVWLATTLTLCVVFVPKIKMRNDIQPTQNTMMTQATQVAQPTAAQKQIHELRQEINRMKSSCKCSASATQEQM